MSKELKPKYDFKEVEEGKYDFWLKGGFFEAGDKEKEPFTIVIPPPNVTGKLHLGHSWDTTLQDIIIRRKRMQQLLQNSLQTINLISLNNMIMISMQLNALF